MSLIFWLGNGRGNEGVIPTEEKMGLHLQVSTFTMRDRLIRCAGGLFHGERNAFACDVDFQHGDVDLWRALMIVFFLEVELMRGHT